MNKGKCLNYLLFYSAFFNLTANVMGVPIHVVEAAVMVEGLETVLEDVFGPEGVLPDTTIFNLFNFTFTKVNDGYSDCFTLNVSYNRFEKYLYMYVFIDSPVKVLDSI